MKDKKSSGVRKIVESTVGKIQKKFPRFYGVYSLVINGFRGVFDDTKKYFVILAKTSKHEKGKEVLNVQELDFFHRYRSNLQKLLPLVVLGVLPFGNGLIIPLARSLTSHFWTEKQKQIFPEVEFAERARSYKPILMHLNDYPLKNVPNQLVSNWHNCLKRIEQGSSVNCTELIKYSSIFDKNGPYFIHSLSTSHIMNLLNLYGLYTFLFRMARIQSFVDYNLLLDRKIKQVGGPKKLSDEIRQNICFMRGLNPHVMKSDEQINFLEKWLELNQKTTRSNCSWLLHTPVLLGYNYEFVRKITDED